MAITFDPISGDNLLNAGELSAGFTISGTGALANTTFDININGTLFSVMSNAAGEFSLALMPVDLMTAGTVSYTHLTLPTICSV